jgi:CBS domain-containing protein
MTSLVGKPCSDAELLNNARKALSDRTRLLTPDATLAALQDLKLWVAEEVSFEEAASASFGRALSELWHTEYLDQLPPLLNKFERLASAYFVRRGSVTAFHGFCNAWREGVLRRVLLFAEEELEVTDDGQPVVPYALLAAGCLGRHEQTLEETDPYFLIRCGGDGEYFDNFAYRVMAILDQFGLLGKGRLGSVARLLWHGTLEEWKNVAAAPEAEGLGNRVQLLADLRFISGDEEIGREAVAIGRAELETCRTQQAFPQLINQAVAEQVALGVFGGIRVDRSGEHPGTLHLWASGLSPLVSVVKLLAVQHGLEVGPTLARLGALGVMGVLEKDLVERLEGAYHFLAGLAIGKEIALEQPYLNPTELTAVDQQKLKGALESVRQLQRVVRRTQLRAKGAMTCPFPLIAEPS